MKSIITTEKSNIKKFHYIGNGRYIYEEIWVYIPIFIKEGVLCRIKGNPKLRCITFIDNKTKQENAVGIISQHEQKKYENVEILLYAMFRRLGVIKEEYK